LPPFSGLKKRRSKKPARKQVATSTSLRFYETCAYSILYLYVKGRHLTINIYLSFQMKDYRNFKDLGWKLEGKM
jgi:hypothetical protein